MVNVTVPAHIVKLITTLLPILSQVESNNNDHAVGDQGRSIGRYQIMRPYWSDACRIMGVSWPYSDARDPVKAAKAVAEYLGYYGAMYERQTGKRCTLEVLAAIRNGGPDGWKKRVTRPYQRKVNAILFSPRSSGTSH